MTIAPSVSSSRWIVLPSSAASPAGMVFPRFDFAPSPSSTSAAMRFLGTPPFAVSGSTSDAPLEGFAVLAVASSASGACDPAADLRRRGISRVALSPSTCASRDLNGLSSRAFGLAGVSQGTEGGGMGID